MTKEEADRLKRTIDLLTETRKEVKTEEITFSEAFKSRGKVECRGCRDCKWQTGQNGRCEWGKKENKLWLVCPKWEKKED